MNHEYYPYEVSKNSLSFSFNSLGQQIVRKLVEYVPIDENIYNLAFGDLNQHGKLDDFSISNNQDMEIVLATVIQTILIFFETYPDKILFFKGSTTTRTRLYQITIAKEYENWKSHFLIRGIKGDFVEIFRKNINYDAFLIQLKPELI